MQDYKSIEKNELNSLILGCIRNHRSSQELVYKKFYGKMMAVCKRYTNNEDQAKDILQDGWIKVFKNIDKFNFKGSFEGWVRRIVVNTAIDYFRRSKNDYLLMNENNSLEDFEDTLIEEDVEIEELPLNISDIVSAMHKLSPAYRTVFNLYIFEDHTHKEIAELLDISEGTSKSNLAKAKLNLRKILNKELKTRNAE